MDYFDFHAHILLKQLFRDPIDMNERIDKSDVGLIVGWCTDLPNILETQIHQKDLESLNGQILIGAALYSLEKQLAIVVTPLRRYLKQNAQDKLSENLLNDIASNKTKSFSDFMCKRTLQNYLREDSGFNVVGKDSFSNPLPTSKVSIFFVIEGCHSLVDSINQVNSPTSGYSPKEILSNLDLVLAKAPVLSVNLTHMQQSNICNHAFGMQLADPSPFYPAGNGMTADGASVVQGLFDRKVCVDLKHMSFKSRLDLYISLKKGQYSNPQPLLCSHAGFTGVPFNSWPGYIHIKDPSEKSSVYVEICKTSGSKNGFSGPANAYFNLSTINLFDEDIVEIVQSGGMIGLSMDRRILGYVDPFDDKIGGKRPEDGWVVDKEFFSHDEWRALGIQDSEIGKNLNADDCETLEDLQDIAGSSAVISERNIFFYEHVLLHLKHFLQTCLNAGIPLGKAQQHITIGSDFDGLINPFLNFCEVLDMPGLKHYIQKELMNYLNNWDDAKLWSGQIDIDKFVDQLFFDNGYQFVKGRICD